MAFFCDRPHEKTVDFDASRFVVSTSRGLDLGSRMLERGEEVPRGLLTPRTLRYEYMAHRIELVSSAKTDPSLSEACALKGVDLEPRPALRPRAPRPEILEELEAMTRKQLCALCEKYGVSSDGNKFDLCQRLSTVVG